VIGKVIDKLTNDPVENAIVSVHNENKIVFNAVSDSTGMFKIPVAFYRKASLIRIHVLSYSDLEITIIPKIAHYYSDAACTQPLALPAPLTHYVTWTKYYSAPLPNAGQQYTVNSQYTAAQGATLFSFGHREFYSSIPPATIYSDWVAAVALQNDNPAYTAEPNYGTFTNN
jgi:hypothetical protein